MGDCSPHVAPTATAPQPQNVGEWIARAVAYVRDTINAPMACVGGTSADEAAP